MKAGDALSREAISLLFRPTSSILGSSPGQDPASTIEKIAGASGQRSSGAKLGPGDREIAAADLLKMYDGDISPDDPLAAQYQTLVSELKKAAKEGKSFVIHHGEVKLAGMTLVIGSNLSPEIAQEAARERGEDARKYVNLWVDELRQAVESTYEDTLSRNPTLSRARFEELRDDRIKSARASLEQYNFQGGEIVTDGNGNQTLGAYTMSFRSSVRDYNGKEWGFELMGSGGAGQPISFTSRSMVDLHA